MTTETVELTPAQKLEAAQKRSSDAKAAFDAMISAGKDFEPGLDDTERYAKQVSIFAELDAANKAVVKLEADVKAAEHNAKLAPINEKLNGLRDRIRTAIVNSKVEDDMKAAEAGNVVTMTITFSEADNSPAINFRVAGMSAPKSGANGSGGTRARLKIVADGAEYTPTEYLDKYFEAGTAAGLNWGDKAERMAYKQDHSKRARELAAKLSHSVNQ